MVRAPMSGRFRSRAPVAVLSGAAVLALQACSGVPFLVPDTRSPADFARGVQPKCKTFPEADAAPLLSRDAYDSVEGAYDHVNSGPVDREARLRGAKLHVRPLAGLSRETIARRVECHEARVVLGEAQAAPDDPFALPGRWLDVDVDSEGDGFAILMRTDTFADAQEALARAKRFVAAPAPSPAPH
jgi:hypothetical protein